MILETAGDGVDCALPVLQGEAQRGGITLRFQGVGTQ